MEGGLNRWEAVWARGKAGVWTRQGCSSQPLSRLSKALKGCFVGCWISIYGRWAGRSGCQNTGSLQRNSEGMGSAGKVGRMAVVGLNRQKQQLQCDALGLGFGSDWDWKGMTMRGRSSPQLVGCHGRWHHHAPLPFSWLPLTPLQPLPLEVCWRRLWQQQGLLGCVGC